MNKKYVVERPHIGHQGQPDLVGVGRAAVTIEYDEERSGNGHDRGDSIVEDIIDSLKRTRNEGAGEDPVEDKKE
jgi:hypothetical protein